MFGLTSLELRLAFYGVLLAAICGYVLYERHQGYEECRAPQKAADKAQIEKDLAVAKGTIDELKAKLAAANQSAPTPVVRLCPQPSRVRAQSPSSGTQPPVAADTGTSSVGVPSGASGIDIGTPLSDLKRAAEVVAIYRDETWGWAVKQSK